MIGRLFLLTLAVILVKVIANILALSLSLPGAVAIAVLLWCIHIINAVSTS